MKVKLRNKDCENCPQNKREDIVWEKGLYDGRELERTGFKRLFWKIYIDRRAKLFGLFNI